MASVDGMKCGGEGGGKETRDERRRINVPKQERAGSCVFRMEASAQDKGD